MSTATLSPDAFTFVSTLVRTRSAIELEPNKAYLIEARLSPIAKQNGFATTTDFLQNLKAKRQSALESKVVEAMTTNETSFFRDAHPFEALKTTVLPEVIKLRATQRSFNIWSAACSTGQEIYSIAMLIREQFPELLNWKVNLLGTDLSDEVLDKCSQGKFSQVEVNRGLPAPMLVKYFQREGMQWQLKPELRAMASFRKLNLIETWLNIPQMDVVFLRNVLIYFSPENKKLILAKIRKVMAPHAVLFLGAAETTMNLDTSFERVQNGNSVFYRLK